MEILSSNIEIRCSQCKNRLSKLLRLQISPKKDNRLIILRFVKERLIRLKLWMISQRSNLEKELNKAHLKKCRQIWFSQDPWTLSRISLAISITCQMRLRKFRNKCPNNLPSSTTFNSPWVDLKLATEMINLIIGALKRVSMQVRAVKAWNKSSRFPDAAMLVTIVEPLMFREPKTVDLIALEHQRAQAKAFRLLMGELVTLANLSRTKIEMHKFRTTDREMILLSVRKI